MSRLRGLVLGGLALGGLATLCASCSPRGSGTDAGAARAATPELGGEIVAVVGDVVIRRAAVLAYAVEHHVSARDALTELESVAILANEARARGLTTDDVADLEQQALAQLVLRSVEREHGEDDVTEAQIGERVPAVTAAMTHVERRQAAHLLVRFPDDADAAARQQVATWGAEALAMAQQQSEVSLERVATRIREDHESADVIVETLPLADASVALEAPFRDALFQATGEGIVPRVVTTSFGAHVIDVVRIDPAVTPTAEAVRERARHEALVAQRRAAFQVLVRGLARATPPRLEEAVITRRLGDDSLFGGVR